MSKIKGILGTTATITTVLLAMLLPGQASAMKYGAIGTLITDKSLCDQQSQCFAGAEVVTSDTAIGIVGASPTVALPFSLSSGTWTAGAALTFPACSNGFSGVFAQYNIVTLSKDELTAVAVQDCSTGTTGSPELSDITIFKRSSKTSAWTVPTSASFSVSSDEELLVALSQDSKSMLVSYFDTSTATAKGVYRLYRIQSNGSYSLSKEIDVTGTPAKSAGTMATDGTEFYLVNPGAKGGPVGTVVEYTFSGTAWSSGTTIYKPTSPAFLDIGYSLFDQESVAIRGTTLFVQECTSPGTSTPCATDVVDVLNTAGTPLLSPSQQLTETGACSSSILCGFYVSPDGKLVVTQGGADTGNPGDFKLPIYALSSGSFSHVSNLSAAPTVAPLTMVQFEGDDSAVMMPNSGNTGTLFWQNTSGTTWALASTWMDSELPGQSGGTAPWISTVIAGSGSPYWDGALQTPASTYNAELAHSHAPDQNGEALLVPGNNLQLTITPAASAVATGTTTTVTVKVKNLDPASPIGENATSASAKLVFPGAVSVTGATGATCSSSSATVTCAIGSVNVGATATVSLQVQPTADGASQIQGTVTSALPADFVASNTATASFTSDTAPVATSTSIKILASGGGNALPATQADGRAMTYSVVTGPAHGTLSLTAGTGVFTYTPGSGFTGTDSFTWKANDGIFDSNTATMTMNETASDSAPSATPSTVTLDLNTYNAAVAANPSNVSPGITTTAPTNLQAAASGVMSGTDPDGNPIYYTVSTAPLLGVLYYVPGSGAWTYYPIGQNPCSASSGGQSSLCDTFSFKTTDGMTTSSAAQVTIAVPANPVPTLGALTPASAKAGGDTFTLTLSGSNFVSGAMVEWNGTSLSTSYVSATKLTAQVDASLIKSAGTATVAVLNPGPGGGASGSSDFTISSSSSGGGGNGGGGSGGSGGGGGGAFGPLLLGLLGLSRALRGSRGLALGKARP